MTDDLLIPLAWLPGHIPAGAPVVGVYTGDLGVACESVGHYQRGPGYRVWSSLAVGASWAPEAAFALDLTPPPLDADGYPTRIDGLGVAAAMLARALGLPRYVAPRWSKIRQQEWEVSTDAAPGQRPARPRPHEYARRFCPDGLPPAMRWEPSAPLWAPAVPALRNIDPTDPLASRRAMVEVFRARVWEASR